MSKVTYNKKYGYSFPGKYLLLGALGIAGLIFTTGTIQTFFGVYIFGCLVGYVLENK
tara:strand:+ start:715 stop:885 length:171 start_codon:yes stop_codon:yes gene_type:complete